MRARRPFNGVVPVFSYMTILLAAGSAVHAPAPPVSAARAALSACSLVSQADVRQAFGRAVAAGVESRDGEQSSCDYDGGNGQVTITVRRLAAPIDLQVEIAALQRSIPEGRVRAAGGMGPAAFFLDIPGAGAQLYVVRGGAFVMVSALGFGEAARVSDAAAALARKALAGL